MATNPAASDHPRHSSTSRGVSQKSVGCVVVLAISAQRPLKKFTLNWVPVVKTPYLECSTVAQPEATITGIDAASASRGSFDFHGRCRGWELELIRSVVPSNSSIKPHLIRFRCDRGNHAKLNGVVPHGFRAFSSTLGASQKLREAPQRLRYNSGQVPTRNTAELDAKA
jgi:hypothetical protein